MNALLAIVDPASSLSCNIVIANHSDAPYETVDPTYSWCQLAGGTMQLGFCQRGVYFPYASTNRIDLVEEDRGGNYCRVMLLERMPAPPALQVGSSGTGTILRSPNGSLLNASISWVVGAINVRMFHPSAVSVANPLRSRHGR